MRKFILTCLLLLVPTLVGAQTITSTAVWQQADTLSNVQGYVYTIKVDTAVAVQVTQTCVNTTPVSANVNCTAPVTVPQTAGTHTITLTAINGFGNASASVSGAAPGTPVSFTIITKYTVP